MNPNKRKGKWIIHSEDVIAWLVNQRVINSLDEVIGEMLDNDEYVAKRDKQWALNTLAGSGYAYNSYNDSRDDVAIAFGILGVET